MIQVLIAIALKSVLIAGLTLGLLQLMRRRSAAERSWVAHIGLLALVIMAFAPLVLPTWNVEAPALFGSAPSQEVVAQAPSTLTPVAGATTDRPVAVAPVAPKQQPSISAGAAASAIYALPAAVLLLITFLALARLIALRARAEVLVDAHWLSALARAQRRMGFKHGTALLTSNELASPISWGLMRPVILLNSRAVEASNEAEAIISHELAHVARMDWIKLLLARVATALFWFNPLVWMLAREAHQLREEAADDAVLAADISDTDYAQLLVGVARHECPGLLLGAHGVAPSKSSLARRVARVLDGTSLRGPAAGTFAIGVFVGAVVIAAPLAALNLTPAGAKDALTGAPASRDYPAPYYAPHVAADLPHIIAQGVSTSVATAMAAVQPGDFAVTSPDGASVTRRDGTTVARGSDGSTSITRSDGTTIAYGADGSASVTRGDGSTYLRGSDGATVTTGNGMTVARGSDGATVTTYPPDAQGRSRVVARAADGATAVSYVDAATGEALAGAVAVAPGRYGAIDRAVEAKAVGITREYVDSIRSAAPGMRFSHDDIVGMKAVGVTPEFIRELTAGGYRDLNADDVTGAYAMGIRPGYIRAMAAVGFSHLSLEQLIELKSVGITPAEVERFRRAGFPHIGVDQLVEAKTMGLTPEELRASGRDDP
ncbi:MAG TPA: M56 family metallopeptidase [Sphingomicrobium sp.]|nr:M56 family metallopeptidase [Sphingomicrobium sp.]